MPKKPWAKGFNLPRMIWNMLTQTCSMCFCNSLLILHDRISKSYNNIMFYLKALYHHSLYTLYISTI